MMVKCGWCEESHPVEQMMSFGSRKSQAGIRYSCFECAQKRQQVKVNRRGRNAR